MKKTWLFSLSVLAVPFLTLPSAAQDENQYTSAFRGADSLSGSPGTTVSGSYDVIVTHAGPGVPGDSNGDGVADPGEVGSAQGWSISVTADNATITAINDGVADQSTDGGALFAGGFNQTELTPDPDRNEGDCDGQTTGAISAVALSFQQPRVLPANATSSIAILAVEATIPAGGGSATLRFADGCRGIGVAVENVISQEGGSAENVTYESKEIALIEREGPKNCCDAVQVIGFSAENLRVATAVTGFADASVDEGGNPICNASGGEIEGVGSVKAYASISTAEGSVGVQGWSFSIEVTGDVDITAVTTDGTSGGTVETGGRQDGGFEATDIVDPTKKQNAGRRGCISAIVLSFGQAIILGVPSTESGLEMTCEPLCEEGFETCSGKLQYRDGLTGIAEPVDNVITVAGISADVCNFDDGADPPESLADVTVTILGGPVVTLNTFRRADSNDDGRVNIADPIWTINMLFRQGPPSPCMAAADANDDGVVDLADAIYTVEYRFLHGPTPPAPFPGCGLDETDDELTCGANGVSPSCGR